MKATVLNENGKAQVMTMGCYGIGVSRVVAAAIEQNYDKQGICWPSAIAPFQLSIVPLNYFKSAAVKAAADALYKDLSEQGYEVLLDDRNMRPGAMFADHELLGIPHRVVISDRGLKKGEYEYKARQGGEVIYIPLEQINAFIAKTI
jgi:prolyl-tRNA synthetase